MKSPGPWSRRGLLGAPGVLFRSACCVSRHRRHQQVQRLKMGRLGETMCAKCGAVAPFTVMGMKNDEGPGRTPSMMNETLEQQHTLTC